MSNEQATPRTDANLRGWQDELPAPFVEFTRQLERELANKTAECERLSALAVSFMAAVDKVRGYIDSTVSEGASADILAPLDAVMDVAKALAATRKG